MNLIQTIQALALVCQVNVSGMANIELVQKEQKKCVAELLECMSQPVTFSGDVVSQCLRK